jgi:hypothetical protein
VRGLTDEEAVVLRDEAVWEGEAVSCTAHEEIVYARLVRRGLLTHLVDAYTEVDEDGTRYDVDRWVTTDTGRLALRIYDMMKVGLAS